MLKYSTVTVCYSFRYVSKLDQNITLTLLLQYKLKTQYILYVKLIPNELVWPYLGNKRLINVGTYFFRPISESIVIVSGDKKQALRF